MSLNIGTGLLAQGLAFNINLKKSVSSNASFLFLITVFMVVLFRPRAKYVMACALSQSSSTFFCIPDRPIDIICSVQGPQWLTAAFNNRTHDSTHSTCFSSHFTFLTSQMYSSLLFRVQKHKGHHCMVCLTCQFGVHSPNTVSFRGL